MLRPVLLKIENPKQLQALEEAAPQLYGADAEIWINLIKRDIPNAEEKMIYPHNPKSWWKVYQKMWSNYQKELAEDDVKLKNAFRSLKEAKKPPTAILEGTPWIPKERGMDRAHLFEYNQCYAKKPKGPKPRLIVQKLGSPTRQLTPKGAMARIRRRTSEECEQSKALPDSPDRLKSLLSQIPAAPQWMIDEKRKAKTPKPLDPNVPARAAVDLPRSKNLADDRPRLSAAQLMDQKNREYVEEQNKAKREALAYRGTYMSAGPKPRKRPSPPEYQPGVFMNVFTGATRPTPAKKRRME
ncbi:MAG: hypothetical protein Q9221_004032 [Calogaya cf. arnoldii]